MTIYIHRPPTFALRRIVRCPTCKRRRRIAGLDAPWYGPTWTCCSCGESWADGELLARPFKRGWRREAAARAKAIWAAAGTPAEHRAWLDEQLADDDWDETLPDGAA